MLQKSRKCIYACLCLEIASLSVENEIVESLALNFHKQGNHMVSPLIAVSYTHLTLPTMPDV